MAKVGDAAATSEEQGGVTRLKRRSPERGWTLDVYVYVATCPMWLCVSDWRARTAQAAPSQALLQASVTTGPANTHDDVCLDRDRKQLMGVGAGTGCRCLQ